MKVDPSIDRLEELWADRATGGDDDNDRAEIADLRRRLGIADDFTSLDFCSGQLCAGFASHVGLEPMPERVQARILKSIESKPNPIWKITPWLVSAVAASIAIFVTFHADSPATPANFGPNAVVSASWSDWDSPEVAGVRGEVTWCEQGQFGTMRFTGLPVNDPAKERYQLWIIDSRGMSQRISGGVFDSTGSEVLVRIDPGIRVCGAQAFAVTIERPEGVWVSDMTRRVTIAQLASK